MLQWLQYLAIASLPISALAVDSLPKPTHPTKRGNPGLYVCSGPNFQGDCVYLPGTLTGRCQPFAPPVSTWLTIGSIGPDAGQSCRVFQNPDCTGLAGHDGAGDSQLRYPGPAALAFPKLMKEGEARWMPRGFVCY